MATTRTDSRNQTITIGGKGMGPVRPAGEVYVKGKAHSVQIFEVLWNEAQTRTRHTDPSK